MKQYIKLIKEVLNNGEIKKDRTGIGTLSIFGYQSRYDLREGFPLVTTKKIIFESVVRELLWFLSGSTNINDLYPCKIWDNWADEKGNLGPIYGFQWRNWNGIDQIKETITTIKNNPESRRIIISAWNVSDIKKMALPPCHCFFQFYVNNKYLDCQLYQRSADIALGVPFNIASYSLLLSIIAKECDLIPRYFIHTLGDAHIYLNHIDNIKQQIKRTPKPLPDIEIKNKNIFDITLEDIILNNYEHHDFIKFDIAI